MPRFNITTNECQEATLRRLSETLDIKTKSKTIIWLIENFERVENELMHAHNELRVTETELENLKYQVKQVTKHRKYLEKAESELQKSIN